jgi:hypothetical protein
MDPISITFYAVICGVLSMVAPNLGGTIPRLGIGAVVGVLAAVALPFIRSTIGY